MCELLPLTEQFSKGNMKCSQISQHLFSTIYYHRVCFFPFDLTVLFELVSIYLLFDLMSMFTVFYGNSCLFRFHLGCYSNQINNILIYRPCQLRKTKTQISCAVTAQLISAFVFPTWISTSPPLLIYKISSF